MAGERAKPERAADAEPGLGFRVQGRGGGGAGDVEAGEGAEPESAANDEPDPVFTL
jgi:hypothetical protein